MPRGPITTGSSTLYRSDDPELAISKKKAFDILYGTARASLVAHRSETVTDADRPSV